MGHHPGTRSSGGGGATKTPGEPCRFHRHRICPEQRLAILLASNTSAQHPQRPARRNGCRFTRRRKDQAGYKVPGVDGNQRAATTIAAIYPFGTFSETEWWIRFHCYFPLFRIR